MAWWVKTPSAKLDDLSSVPKNHTVKVTLVSTYSHIHNERTDKHETGKGHFRRRAADMATDLDNWGSLPIALVPSQLTDLSLVSLSQMVLSPSWMSDSTQKT